MGKLALANNGTELEKERRPAATTFYAHLSYPSEQSAGRLSAGEEGIRPAGVWERGGITGNVGEDGTTLKPENWWAYRARNRGSCQPFWEAF